MSGSALLVVGTLSDDPSDVKNYLIASVNGNDYWPVGSHVSIRSLRTGNLLALGRVEMSMPGKAQIEVTKRFI